MNGASATPNLTPTATGAAASASRDESLLVNGLGGMSLGGGLGIGGGPARDPRGMLPFDRDFPPQSFGGPIGSNRSFSLSYDDPARDRGQGMPTRQPRGPLPERGPGFPKSRPPSHRQRGSDESSLPIQSVEIVVE